MRTLSTALAALLAATIALSTPAALAGPIRVACAGDSITKGIGTNPGKSFPAQLGKLLGRDYAVGEFGANGRVLQRKGPGRSYLGGKYHRRALAFRPNVVVIMLGTNDCKAAVDAKTFITDYKALIATFTALPTKPKVYLCTPPPIVDGIETEEGETIKARVVGPIKQVAKDMNLPLIDCYTAMAGDDKEKLTADSVHPNDAGAAVIAKTIAAALKAPPAQDVKPVGKQRLAVLGDSLSTDNRWPPALAKHLGNSYEVKSFASGGMTLLRNMNPRNVWKRYEARRAQEFRPSVVLMMFGVIEGTPKAWPRSKAGFVAGYKDLIKMFKDRTGKRKIYLLLPPAAKRDAFGNNTAFMHKHVVPTIKQIGSDMGVKCLDTHTPFIGRSDANDDWDGLHTNVVGNEIIARIVATELTGKVLPLPARPKEPTAEERAAEQAEHAVKADHVVKMAVGDSVELTAADIANPKGDGPDGKGNSSDDTWQFWFGFISAGHHRLTTATATMSADHRKNGVVDPKARPGHRKKVTGPIAADLPNPQHTEGWILHTDWNGRFEGFWGDRKANCVLAHPYVEKTHHGSVSVTFRVPADGVYDVAGKVTDLQVIKFRRHTGVTWQVEVARERIGKTAPKPRAVLAKGGPIGDKVGPDSGEFTITKASLNKGDLLRLVIDPNDWWGTDLTRIDRFRITRTK